MRCGSAWQDNELRYSLRSVEKHLSGVRQVVIVGERPKFLKNVHHIPYPDRNFGNRNRNIYEKILQAAKAEEVSEDFYCSSDDIFLLQDFDVNTFPCFQRGPLAEQIGSCERSYRNTLINTEKALQVKELPTVNFNLHSPFIFNKYDFLRVMRLYKQEIAHGYAVKSLYANSLQLQGEYLQDCKPKQPLTRTEITAVIAGRPFFSIGDTCLDSTMKSFLQEQYPEKSRWEV